MRKAPAHFSILEHGFRSNIIYLTICTKDRKPILANDEAADSVIHAWRSANFWLVGRYVIMPDHIHLFCAPNTFPPRPLKTWISFWRNNVTRAWPNRSQLPIWQREFWDRQLRTADSYSAKWEYVRNNSVRHEYVSRPDDWPYQGELNRLEWHDP
jgi:REP element-mobilizing transposase RayT